MLTTLGVQPANIFDIKSHSLVDANIGLHASNDAWRFTLWGKNLFNKFYNTNVIQA